MLDGTEAICRVEEAAWRMINRLGRHDTKGIVIIGVRARESIINSLCRLGMLTYFTYDPNTDKETIMGMEVIIDPNNDERFEITWPDSNFRSS
jgi:hypothetical protein